MNISRASAQVPKPVKLKAKSGIHNGATGFFRNRAFLDVLAGEIFTLAQDDINVFMHACSVGPEPYSLAITAHTDSRLSNKNLNITATDINPEFINQARDGVYPIELLNGFTAKEKLFTKTVVQNPDVFILDEVIRSSVDFIEPCSAIDFKPSEEQNITFIMNALCYVTSDEQKQAIMNAADYTQNLLCVTAFNPDTIASDLQEAGFEPVIKRQEDIHNGWVDRRTKSPVDPEKPEYLWKLGQYDTSVDDFHYRYGAIFKRH